MNPSLATPLSLKHERELLCILAGIQFSHILDFMVLMPLGPVLIKSLALSTHEFALLVSAYTLAAAVSGFLAAAFVDLFERKRLLLLFFFIFILSTLWCAAAGSFESLLTARAMAGAFGGVLAAMVQTMVADLIPFERRGQASASVMSATAVASVLGVPMALLLSNVLSWRVPFVAIGVLAAIFLLLASMKLPSLRSHLLHARCPQANARISPTANLVAVLRERNHCLAILFMALGGGSTFVVIPYITLYLTGSVGVAAELIPLVYAIGGTASFFSARFIGRLADNWGKVKSYRIVAALSILPIFALTHLPAVALGWVLLCTTVFFALGPGRAVSAMAITMSAVKPAQRGTFMSLNAAIQQMANGLAAYIGGMLISQSVSGEISGYGTAGWVAIVITGMTLYLSGKIQLHQVSKHAAVEPESAAIALAVEVQPAGVSK
ncbi:MFS transporter [Chitinibacter sp. SCUT-21]|uniref:MFS transporter n=1 Tax=Chitinibacter sp. SCUT-21 TaxID=2970891 RepID=UPI0035A64A6B